MKNGWLIGREYRPIGESEWLLSEQKFQRNFRRCPKIAILISKTLNRKVKFGPFCYFLFYFFNLIYFDLLVVFISSKFGRKYLEFFFKKKK